jgi:hypothetical protein
MKGDLDSPDSIRVCSCASNSFELDANSSSSLLWNLNTLNSRNIHFFLQASRRPEPLASPDCHALYGGETCLLGQDAIYSNMVVEKSLAEPWKMPSLS